MARSFAVFGDLTDLTDLEPAVRADGWRDFEGLPAQPLALLGERNYRKPV